MIFDGTIVSVVEESAGTELSADALATDTEIEVVDIEALDLEGGTLEIHRGEDDAFVTAYTIPDEEGTTVELADPLPYNVDAEETALIYPAELERLAYLTGPDEDEELEARVPHALYDRLPVGIREDEATAEAVVATLDDDEWVVTDVLGQTPTIDASFLNSGQEDAPLVFAATLTTSYTATDATLTVTPEADGKLLVFWAAAVAFIAGVANDAIHLNVHVSLLVDGVQTGPEARGEVSAVFNADDPEIVMPFSGATVVEVKAGVEVELAVGGKVDSGGTGAADIQGGKTGGLSYVAFGN